MCDGNWIKSHFAGSNSADSLCKKTLELAVSLWDPGQRCSHPASSVDRQAALPSSALGHQPGILGWTVELHKCETALPQRILGPPGTPPLPRPVCKTGFARPPSQDPLFTVMEALCNQAESYILVVNKPGPRGHHTQILLPVPAKHEVASSPLTQNPVFIKDLLACLGALLPTYLAQCEGRAIGYLIIVHVPLNNGL